MRQQIMSWCASTAAAHGHYFLGACWRRTKLGVASTLTLVSGGVLLYGALATGGTFNIVLGALGLAGSAVIFVDSTKVQADLAKAMRENALLLADYRQTAADFQQENRQLHESVEALDGSLKQSARQVGKLQLLQNRHQKLIEQMKAQLHTEQLQGAQLQERIDELRRVESEFQQENAQLQRVNAEAAEQGKRLTTLYEQAAASDAAHQSQVAKLKLIVESSQKVLLTVASEGDRFGEFGAAIDSQLIRLDQQAQSVEHTARVMDTLLNRLQEQTFEKLDGDGDGVVTAAEFANGVRAQRSLLVPLLQSEEPDE